MHVQLSGWLRKQSQKRVQIGIVALCVLIILFGGGFLFSFTQPKPVRCPECVSKRATTDNSFYVLNTLNVTDMMLMYPTTTAPPAQLFKIDPESGKALHATTLVSGSIVDGTVFNGILYGSSARYDSMSAGDDIMLFAVRLSDSKIIWKYDAGFHNTEIYLATPGMLYVLRDNSPDAANPVLADTNNSSNHSISQNSYFTQSSQSTTLLALNTANGQVVWQHDFQDVLVGTNDTILQDGGTIISVTGSEATSKTFRTTVTAFRAEDGSVLWSHDLQGVINDGSAAATSAANDSHHLFVAIEPDSNSSQIVEFDDRNGDISWQGRIASSHDIPTLSIAEHNLVITASTGSQTGYNTILYVLPIARPTVTWSYTPTPQQDNFTWTITADTAYAMWTTINPQTFAQHAVIAAWRISDGKKLWQADTQMSSKFVNLSILPAQIVLFDPRGTDIEVHQAITGALLWHKHVPHPDIAGKKNWNISAIVPTSKLPGNYSPTSTFEDGSYDFSAGLAQHLPAIYVDMQSYDPSSIPSSIDQLYALDIHDGHILWQRDPTTLGLDLLPTPTPIMDVKPTLLPTHGPHDFTNFVGTWGRHNGALVFKANGDAQLMINCPTCTSSETINMHFTQMEQTKATGTITAESASAMKIMSTVKVGTVVTATLQDNDTLDLEAPTLRPGSQLAFLCGPKAPGGYCGT